MTSQKLFSASAVLSLITAYFLVTSPQADAAAEACAITVESTDAMTFSTKTIEVSKACKDYTITLKNTGKMDKKMMGHNIVVTKESDQAGVLEAGSKAGALSQYIKAKDERVIAFTDVIGGGETSSAKFAVSKLVASEKYVFFCSFPGHAFVMKGVLKLV